MGSHSGPCSPRLWALPHPPGASPCWGLREVDVDAGSRAGTCPQRRCREGVAELKPAPPHSFTMETRLGWDFRPHPPRGPRHEGPERQERRLRGQAERGPRLQVPLFSRTLPLRRHTPTLSRCHALSLPPQLQSCLPAAAAAEGQGGAWHSVPGVSKRSVPQLLSLGFSVSRWPSPGMCGLSAQPTASHEAYPDSRR